MQFLLFDVSATLVFLLGYLAVVALQRRRAPAVMGASGHAQRGAQPRAAPRERRNLGKARKESPTEPCCREWPRLSAPR